MSDIVRISAVPPFPRFSPLPRDFSGNAVLPFPRPPHPLRVWDGNGNEKINYKTRSRAARER